MLTVVTRKPHTTVSSSRWCANFELGLRKRTHIRTKDPPEIRRLRPKRKDHKDLCVRLSGVKLDLPLHTTPDDRATTNGRIDECNCQSGHAFCDGPSFDSLRKGHNSFPVLINSQRAQLVCPPNDGSPRVAQWKRSYGNVHHHEPCFIFTISSMMGSLDRLPEPGADDARVPASMYVT
ncbi:Protein NHR-187 [Anopheles sinensis]|uniref:Protein NHR-187 n=1 Tax=Anopheles sinensis TaxID=74873 RepID=A0A084WGQ0_ANOSI|nr:Protein NHR-187 [Anopheles sinensis]